MKVILLNQDYSYINSISVRRALRLIAKKKVTVEKYSDRIVRTVSQDMAVPLILRLVYLVRQIYRKAVTWSRKNVMVRDDFIIVKFACLFFFIRFESNKGHTNIHVLLPAC